MDLPDDLELPLATGAPWWYWLGGRPSLDLVNTLRERWRRQVETLVTPEDLGAWLVASGVVEQAPPRLGRTVLAQARDLREAIDAGVRAVVAGEPVPVAVVAELDPWLVIAGGRPELVLDADGVPQLGTKTEAESPRRALGLVALDAATMLGTAERARVRVCASETCSARFFDRSPAGRRRWCSMEACGNVAKARRHRERQRAAG